MAAIRMICGFIFVAFAAPLAAQQTTLISFAEQHVAKQPTAERRLGLAEIRRAHGLKTGASDEGIPRAIELACWRMLPVVPAQREAFREQVARLKKAQPTNPWVAVWELYLIAGESDRAAMRTAIERMPLTLPTHFPGKIGEQAHLALLQELGTPRVQAGEQVIAARDHEPLHALRDLDRALSREADFYFAAKRTDDARATLRVRDRLRQSYSDAANHLVEKLFALQLRGETKERDALLEHAQSLAYLHDRQKLAALLERMEEEQAWTRLIVPLLESELKLIATPPDLRQLPVRSIAEVQIKADKKSMHGKTVHYEGNVHFRLHGIEISCQQLTLLQDDDPAEALLAATGNVQLRGIAAYPHGVFADRLAYQAEIGRFTLSGDVRLYGFESMRKLRACTLNSGGDIRDARSLLDDFRQSFTLEAKLELLPKISKIYTDSELPPDIRYLVALNVLRPHLDWHAPYLPPLPERNGNIEERVAQRQEDTLKVGSGYFSVWREAFRGEPWMQRDVPDNAEETFRAKLRAWYQRANSDSNKKPTKLFDLPIPGKDLYFWRIRDHRHVDIARAVKLLEGIYTDNLNAKASRWREEIARNNTVLTFDIAAAAEIDKPHRMLMDARNAEQVRFKLYRVERPGELLYATKRIGTDFIYRDHGLALEHERVKELIDLRMKSRMRSITDRSERYSKEDAFIPAWKASQLVHQWDVHVADLKVHRGERSRYRNRDWDEESWHEDADAHYFDDSCSAHYPRIHKEYRPEQDEQLSSWQCDRIVEIPEKKLREPGAYVLIAESNGASACVPIVVEPMSLTLRRCRDGVFVVVSDPMGAKPVAGAQIHARGQRGEAKTDDHGVAFARVFAAGDRAIVVHHQGRYAIGGFGQVFEGIYSTPYDEKHRWLRDRLMREREKGSEAFDRSAAVYEDQHVVVAYTDRPTYRPGQDVQFKLIVRKLAPEARNAAQPTSFRSDDFDRATTMLLPDLERPIRYAITDPKGREVEHGSLRLSDHGTAAGTVKLNRESVLGAYTFRVHVAGQWRVVPDVFAVKHYRRPNFEVNVDGVPEKLAKSETLKLRIASQYYFGPPVQGGAVEVRVVRGNIGQSIVVAH